MADNQIRDHSNRNLALIDTRGPARRRKVSERRVEKARTATATARAPVARSSSSAAVVCANGALPSAASPRNL